MFFLLLQDPSSSIMDFRRVLWNQWRHPKCDDYDPSSYRGGKSPVVITKLSIGHYKQNNFAKLRVCIFKDINFNFNFWTHLSWQVFAYGIWTGVGWGRIYEYVIYTGFIWLFCRFLLWMMRLRKLQERLKMMVCYTFYTSFIPLIYWHLGWKIALVLKCN